MCAPCALRRLAAVPPVAVRSGRSNSVGWRADLGPVGAPGRRNAHPRLIGLVAT